jgi:hypothetical protein
MTDNKCDMCGCSILGTVFIGAHGKQYCSNCNESVHSDAKDVMIEYLCAMWGAHIMIAKEVSRSEAKGQCLHAARQAVLNGWKDEIV